MPRHRASPRNRLPCLTATGLCPSSAARDRPRQHGQEDSDGDVAQLGERRLCKPEVAGSSPVVSTR